MSALGGEMGTSASLEDGDGVSILVVDDDSAVTSLTEAYLERLEGDVAITCENDPTIAVAKIQEQELDLVVSDYEMPGLDGLELLDEVRADDPTLPFVLFTGREDETVAARARDRRARYVRKVGDTGGFRRLAEFVAEELDGVTV